MFISSDMYHVHILNRSHLKFRKKTELNELNEQDYSKAPSQLSSYAHIHTPLYLQAQICINMLFFIRLLKKLKKFIQFFIKHDQNK